VKKPRVVPPSLRNNTRKWHSALSEKHVPVGYKSAVFSSRQRANFCM